MSLGGNAFQDPLDIVEESHIEHLVRLVEHDGAYGIETQCSTPKVIHDTSRCSDDDIHRVPQSAQLALDRLSTVERDDPCLEIATESVDSLRNLDRQLTCWGQDERLWPVPIGCQSLEDRQCEGCRLAGSGVCLHDRIAASQEYWDGLALYWQGVLEADGTKGFEQLSAQTEHSEGVRTRRRDLCHTH
ncbi:hypothetical protein HRbin27_00240 [bacterium HR27]|nr:hypothetical protein HRbin27_00240 [bacterium HR27]